MAEKKSFLRMLSEGPKKGGPGFYGAVTGFVLALLILVFGFFKTFFVLCMTLAGYYLGLRYFNSKEEFVKLLDKLFPPGTFR